MSNLHGALLRATVFCLSVLISTSSFAMGDIERVARGTAKAVVPAVVPPVLQPLVPSKTLEKQVDKVIQKPLDGPKTIVNDVGKGVAHLGDESWKVIKRPFVETGKFVKDPWGLKKKAADLGKSLKEKGEQWIAYGVMALVGFVAFCGLFSALISRIFSRRPHIVVVTRRA